MNSQSGCFEVFTDLSPLTLFRALVQSHSHVATAVVDYGDTQIDFFFAACYAFHRIPSIPGHTKI